MDYNDNRERDILKKAETIQKYFNKINISRTDDLHSYETNRKEDMYTAFGSQKTSLEGFTSVDQSRIQRYREYEQMAYVPELNAGLELYADDASLYNDENRVLEVTSENQDVVDTLEDLWFSSLDLNANLWHIVYNTCKYGEAFYEIIPDSFKNPKKVKFIRYIPPRYIARQEEDGNLLGFLIKTPDNTSGGGATAYSMAGGGEEIFLKPWQIVHFKLDDKEFEPYGKSVVENGRLSFKQMKLIEDAMLIYRISRAPERRVFNIPVGQLPYREAMQKVEDFKQKYRKTPWIDPTCTSLDTEIPLLNGEVKSLRELIEDYDSGKKNWVYSIDRDNGNQVVPGEILWAGVTRKNTKVLKITLDDGQTFKFTPDHKFLMRDGSYKEAQYLEEGDSIMPLYSKKTKKGYKSVYNPKSGKYYPRYMMSARYTNDNLWNSDWKKSLNEEEYNRIVEGIQIDDVIDGAIQFNTRKQVAEYLNCNPGVILNRLYENGYSNWQEFYRDVNGLENKEDYIRSAVESSNNPKELKTIIGCSLPTAYKYFDQYKSEPVNHKIVSIGEDEEAIDTGTLTINHYHNFAIGRQDSGVFVKNSGEINYKANPLSINDDFFLPQRPDGTGVKIDYMQGGQQLGEIDDARYFKEKILRTMRIPLSYLTGEMQGDVARTSLATMDVRFAKTIERIQKMIIKGLEKVSIIELAFKRFRIDDMYDFQLKLTTPSKIYEMQELETLTQKLNVIQTAMGLADDNGKPYLPREWLYKYINNFSEKEISDIKLMQQTEMIEKQEDARRLELMQQQGAEPGEAGGGEMPGGGPGLAEVPIGEPGGAEGLGGEEAGGEEAGGEAEGGGEEGTPVAAASGGGAAVDVASKILNIAGNDFLLENEDSIREVINFVKQQGETHKITKDNNKYNRRKKRIYENGFNQLFVRGEFRGLIRRRKKENNVLKD